MSNDATGTATSVGGTTMPDDDIGTVRWFGESWGAPANDPRTRIEAPVGLCVECHLPISSDGQGVTIPSGEGRAIFHKICFFDVLGVPHD